MAFIAALASVALSLAAWFAVAARDDQLSNRDFTILTGHHARSLQSGLNRYLEKIRGLRARAAKLAQGYHYSRPVNAAVATALLGRGKIDLARIEDGPQLQAALR